MKNYNMDNMKNYNMDNMKNFNNEYVKNFNNEYVKNYNNEYVKNYNNEYVKNYNNEYVKNYHHNNIKNHINCSNNSYANNSKTYKKNTQQKKNLQSSNDLCNVVSYNDHSPQNIAHKKNNLQEKISNVYNKRNDDSSMNNNTFCYKQGYVPDDTMKTHNETKNNDKMDEMDNLTTNEREHLNKIYSNQEDNQNKKDDIYHTHKRNDESNIYENQRNFNKNNFKYVIGQNLHRDDNNILVCNKSKTDRENNVRININEKNEEKNVD
ncbi:hypothetical protein PFNF54_01033, partial [Plasmodium falciparum NF54]